jgi:hypothetical protein
MNGLVALEPRYLWTPGLVRGASAAPPSPQPSRLQAHPKVNKSQFQVVVNFHAAVGSASRTTCQTVLHLIHRQTVTVFRTVA